MHTIPQNIVSLEQQLAEAVHTSPKAQIAPQIIAVSKQQPLTRIEEALAAGQKHFGENRVQEAEARWKERRDQHSELCLHLIGPLQSNKAAEAVALFDVIHTIDRAKIADTIKAECDRQNRQVKCLVQVNTGEEEQKSGVSVKALPELLTHCQTIGLTISGLMCIPPAGINPAPHFALLGELAKNYALPELSMGMSGDYLTAARLGATYVRIGTALFGERE